jgi:hypothetical protein
MMTDRSFDEDLNEVLIVIHGNIVQAASPEVFIEAFWNILESEWKSARLISLLRALQIQRNDIDREAIIAKIEERGLTELPVEELTSITTDAELCEAVLKRIYPGMEFENVESVPVKTIRNEKEILREIVRRCLANLAPAELEDYDYVFEKVYRVVISTPTEDDSSSLKRGRGVFGGVPFKAAMLTGTTLSTTCWGAYAILQEINERDRDSSELSALESAVERMKAQAVNERIIEEIRQAIIETLDRQ